MAYYRCIGGGEPPAPSSHVNIFNSASTISFSGYNGADILYSQVTSNVGVIVGDEWSNGYEGFNIALNNLEVGHTYTLNFDFQFINANFFGAGEFRTGYAILDTNDTYYEGWNTGTWTENLDRDLNKHTHSETFTATATTMYLSFNVCGCSDYQTNFYAVSNIYADEVV